VGRALHDGLGARERDVRVESPTRETSRLLHESRPRPRRCPGSDDDGARDGEDTLLAEFGAEAREPRHQDAMDRPTKISHDLK